MYFFRKTISRRSRGFGFVRFKTEWDANRAIQRLDGRTLGGRRITVQKARYLDCGIKKDVQIPSAVGTRTALHHVKDREQTGGLTDTMFKRTAVKLGSIQGTNQASIVEGGDLKVVKVASSLVSSLKKDLFHSFVATVSPLNVNEGEIQNRLFSQRRVFKLA